MTRIWIDTQVHAYSRQHKNKQNVGYRSQSSRVIATCKRIGF